MRDPYVWIDPWAQPASNPCPACADRRRQKHEEAEALATLRDRGFKLSPQQAVKADSARRGVSGHD